MAEQPESTDDRLSDMLREGWSIKGYSVCMVRAGFSEHHILVQRDNDLKSLTILIGRGVEKGRTIHQFAPVPPPEKKRGFWI